MSNKTAETTIREIGLSNEEVQKDLELLSDPLSDKTRITRRNLLISSLVGGTLAVADMIPTKIEALGITLEKINQVAFFVVIALVLFYFFVGFLFFAYSDLIRTYWQRIFRTKISTLRLGGPIDQKEFNKELNLVKSYLNYRKKRLFSILRELFSGGIEIKFAEDNDTQNDTVGQSNSTLEQRTIWLQEALRHKLINMYRWSILIEIVFPFIVSFCAFGLVIYRIVEYLV